MILPRGDASSASAESGIGGLIDRHGCLLVFGWVLAISCHIIPSNANATLWRARVRAHKTAWKRAVQWIDWNGNGPERLSILQNDEGVFADGVVTGHLNTSKYGLTYRLGIDLHWHVREVSVQIANGLRLHILSDGRGRWVNENGSEISDLAGCIDVDIAATPFTNTLPIRRLNKKWVSPRSSALLMFPYQTCSSNLSNSDLLNLLRTPISMKGQPHFPQNLRSTAMA